MDDSYILSRGVKALIGDAIAAPGQSNNFCVNARETQTVVQVWAAGAHSALSGNIEASYNFDDSVPTWRVLAAFDLIATKVFTFDAVPGAIYRLNFSTVTDGPSDIYASAG